MKKNALFPLTAMLQIILITLLITIHYGCKKGESESVDIAAILSLTGAGAEFGKDELIGAQMAIDEINNKDSKVQLELIVEDSRTQARDGVSAYHKIINLGIKPVAILSVMSSVSSALAPLVEEDQIPLFCVAAAPHLTQGNTYVFRSLPAGDYQARMLFQLSRKHLNYTSTAILYFNDDFGSSMEHAFSLEANKVGISVLRSEGIQPETSDFRAGLLKLIDSEPDAIYIAAFGSVLGSAVRQLRYLGYRGSLLTTLEIGYPKVLEVAGEASEGAFFVDTKFDAASNDPKTSSFVAQFNNRAKRQPSLDAVLAYDEVQMIYQAGSKRGFTTEGIHKGLLEIEDYESLNGRASMLPSGDVAYELILKTILNGIAVPVNGR